jgi:hypothetical protein
VSWAAGAVEHNVTFDDGEHSATQSSGSFPRTFSAGGAYPYHCTIHGAATMHGSVTVTSGSTTGGTGGSGVVERAAGVADIRDHPATWRSMRTTACSSSLSPDAPALAGDPPLFRASCSVPAS